MNKNRQRRHQFYYERLKREKLNYEKFKQAVKALPTPPIQIGKRVRRKPEYEAM